MYFSPCDFVVRKRRKHLQTSWFTSLDNLVGHRVTAATSSYRFTSAVKLKALVLIVSPAFGCKVFASYFFSFFCDFCLHSREKLYISEGQKYPKSSEKRILRSGPL